MHLYSEFSGVEEGRHREQRKIIRDKPRGVVHGRLIRTKRLDATGEISEHPRRLPPHQCSNLSLHCPPRRDLHQ